MKNAISFGALVARYWDRNAERAAGGFVPA